MARTSPRTDRRQTTTGDDLTELLVMLARGDESMFGLLYDHIAGPVFGLVRRVLRDPAQAEEVTQEVLVEVWRTAPRFDPDRGNARTWIMTMAHRRAVDRVRSEQASRDRESKTVDVERTAPPVDEAVAIQLEHQQVRAALGHLTDIQREAIALAYYGGHTYREVAELLDIPLATTKTRIRDGLIRLRDSLGVMT
jgi:RNA polymerase sigma-70 factor (ECF subfamily)